MGKGEERGRTVRQNEHGKKEWGLHEERGNAGGTGGEGRETRRATGRGRTLREREHRGGEGEGARTPSGNDLNLIGLTH